MSEHSVQRPSPGQTIWIWPGKKEDAGRVYNGVILGFDESGEFALVWWEDTTRDYRYLHWGYDPQMDETMEWG